MLCRAAGFCLFVVAFFLPAGHDTSSHWPGWFAAAWTLANAYGVIVRPHYNQYLQECLLGLSGLVTPLVVLFVLLSLWRKAMTLRLFTAILGLLLLMVANVTIFWSGRLLDARVIPLVGHYCWTAGILLLLVPELVTPRRFSS